jgi:hypothetical protein
MLKSGVELRIELSEEEISYSKQSLESESENWSVDNAAGRSGM